MVDIGLIGCGYIGKKRLEALNSNDKIKGVCDINLYSAMNFGNKYETCYYTDYKDITTSDIIDVVIISTSHDKLAEITLSALKHGKHVLVEKPGARNIQEFENVYNFYHSLDKKPVFKAGFNHRFHPAFQKAKSIIGSGSIGELMFIRSRYGHGGRLGMEKEWRTNKIKSGGGELLDQGSHTIDLSRWFLGDFSKISSSLKTYFWNITVEDNAFMILETDSGKISQLHVSWTEWKNTFSFEIYGKFGKLHIEGLGGSYGPERLYHYQMKPDMLPPEIVIYEYPSQDNSWKLEWLNFENAITKNKTICGDIEDVYQSLKIIDKIYENNNY